MKIKEANEKISLQKMPLIFLVTAVVGILLRSLQMFKYIDHSTGFYTGGTAVTAILYVILFASCIYFLVASFLSTESKKVDLILSKNTPLIIITVFFAISFIWDSVSAFVMSFDSLGTSSGATAFQSMMLSGTIPMFFQSIFAFFSAIYFLILVKSFIKADGRIVKHKILALAPIGWAGFRLIHRFVEQISYIKVSDLFLELILLALMIMFFMSFAQVASGVYSNTVRWRITGFGLSAALLALTLNCSRLVLILFKGSSVINSDYPFSLPDFLFGIFVIILIKTLLSQIAEKETERV